MNLDKTAMELLRGTLDAVMQSQPRIPDCFTDWEDEHIDRIVLAILSQALRWRPPDEAPCDGTHVLVCDSDGFYSLGYRDEDGEWFPVDGYEVDYDSISGWRPILNQEVNDE